MNTKNTLSAEQRRTIRSLAEAAIHAANRHHAPFVDAVANPLQITALLDMADSKADIVDLLDLEDGQDVQDEVKRLLENEGNMLELAQNVQTWHASRLKHTREVQDGVEEGTSVQCGSDDVAGKKITLTAREAMLFKLGMEAGLASFETLPFSLHRKGDEVEVDE